MKLRPFEYVSRNGNIVQPRFYVVKRPLIPLGIFITKYNHRTIIQTGKYVFTTMPK